MLAKMPIMMRRYSISWVYNRTIRTLDSRLDNEKWDNDATSYNINKAALLITLAYNNWSYFTSINDTSQTFNWSNYLNKYFYNNLTIHYRSNGFKHQGYNITVIDAKKSSKSVNHEIQALANTVFLEIIHKQRQKV